MNIFILDDDIKLSAQYHCDKHCVKQILEISQLLCSAHHVSGTDPDIVPYKLSHVNHPCNKWIRESLSNYLWGCDFGLELCYEYTYRYCKTHKTQKVIEWCKKTQPNIPDLGLTPFAQAMPDEFKRPNAVEAYRNYYVNKKEHLFSWKKREEPWWIEIYLAQSAFL